MFRQQGKQGKEAGKQERDNGNTEIIDCRGFRFLGGCALKKIDKRSKQDGCNDVSGRHPAEPYNGPYGKKSLYASEPNGWVCSSGKRFYHKEPPDYI